MPSKQKNVRCPFSKVDACKQYFRSHRDMTRHIWTSALHGSSREEVEQWLKRNGYKIFVCDKYRKRKNGFVPCRFSTPDPSLWKRHNKKKTCVKK